MGDLPLFLGDEGGVGAGYVNVCSLFYCAGRKYHDVLMEEYALPTLTLPIPCEYIWFS